MCIRHILDLRNAIFLLIKFCHILRIELFTSSITESVCGQSFNGYPLLFMIESEDIESIKDLRDPRVLRPMSSLDELLEDLPQIIVSTVRARILNETVIRT